VLCTLAGMLSARVLEFRDQIVSVESETGTRHFTARGLIIPLWIAHQNWKGPAPEAGKPQQFANIEIQKGLYAKPEVPTLQAVVAGVVFPLILAVVGILWAVVLFRYRRRQATAAK
jgi:hypothetical protein